jgi:hypothetical protein
MIERRWKMATLPLSLCFRLVFCFGWKPQPKEEVELVMGSRYLQVQVRMNAMRRDLVELREWKPSSVSVLEQRVKAKKRRNRQG